MPIKLPIIKVVGMSASGKSTLVKALRAHGYDARPVSQEHSNVPQLWKQFDFPKLLIYLDATLTVQKVRRTDVEWDALAHQEEYSKLAHAREHADLRIDTSALNSDQVAKLVIPFLQKRKIRHAGEPLPPVPQTGSAAI